MYQCSNGPFVFRPSTLQRGLLHLLHSRTKDTHWRIRYVVLVSTEQGESLKDPRNEYFSYQEVIRFIFICLYPGQRTGQRGSSARHLPWMLSCFLMSDGLDITAGIQRVGWDCVFCSSLCHSRHSRGQAPHTASPPPPPRLHLCLSSDNNRARGVGPPHGATWPAESWNSLPSAGALAQDWRPYVSYVNVTISTENKNVNSTPQCLQVFSLGA